MRRKPASLGGAFAVCALISVAMPATASAVCPDEDLVASLSTAPRVEAAVLCLINRQRASQRLTPLNRAPKLDLSARFHTATMVRKHFLAHEWAGHPSLLARVRGFGYFAGARDGIYAENVGAGPTSNGTARAMMNAWMDSPDHRRNILYPPFRDVGISVLPAPPDRGFFADFPSTVYTTDFGTRYMRRRRCVRRPTSTAPRAPGSAGPQRRYCRRAR